MPCDRHLSDPVVVCDRAVSIAAPPHLVYAWLCQLRVAPYSYDLFDNWGRPSPRDRDPHLTELAQGQRFMTLFELIDHTPGAQITLRAKGVAVTYAVRPDQAGEGARLHVRARFRGRSWMIAPLLLGDFVMMRKQLLTLRDLAEREAASAPG